MGTSYMQNIIIGGMNRDRTGVPNAVWVGVIEQAFLDALGLSGLAESRRARIHAIKWLFDGGSDFKNVCDLANVNARWVQAAAWKLINFTPEGTKMLEFVLNRHLFQNHKKSLNLLADYEELQRAIEHEYARICIESMVMNQSRKSYEEVRECKK
jgi:hypothetical protein